MRRQLVIMARAAVMGRVKSRLAADIGWVAATFFYRHELARLLRAVGGDPRWTTTVAVTPDRALAEPMWPAPLAGVAQGPGDLGRRMGRIMRAMPAGPVVIAGSDVPGLTCRHIARAFAALGPADAVFGPAGDGGYYLVGFRRVPSVPDAFANVRWSGPHALADTLANLDGLRTAFLEPLDDIDTGEDWRRWRAAWLNASAIRSPHPDLRSEPLPEGEVKCGCGQAKNTSPRRERSRGRSPSG